MGLWRELKFAARQLQANLGFTAIAVLTLTLGIGANTAIFSVMNAVLFRPLPVRNGQELYSINETLAGNAFPTISYPNYRDLRDRVTKSAGLITYEFLPVSMGTAGNVQRTWGYLVSGNYFDVLGVGPGAGRLLHPEDDKVPGGHRLVVISYRLWQQRFGSDKSVIGRQVLVNGQNYSVVGVTPRGFFGTELFFSPDVYFPVMMQKELEGGSGKLERRGNNSFFTVGRLRPGVTLAQAEAELNSLAKRLAEQYPQDNGGLKLVLSPPGLGGSYLRNPALEFASALFGVSLLVLLVACANLASMLLARASDKRKEIALRLALGAGRWTLIKQLLLENLLVALCGGAGGALLAFWIMSALQAWRPPVDIPIRINMPPDLRVLAFTMLVSLFTTFFFGLIPALSATKTDLVSALKNEPVGGRSGNWRLRDYMVGAQVCLSVLLLFCSLLVVESLQRSLDAPLGYKPQGITSVSFDLNTQGYDEPRGRQFERQLLERVRALPGVESAALVDTLPLTLSQDNQGIWLEGQVAVNATEVPLSFSYAASPDYFHTMQTRFREGRDFTSGDNKDSKRVAIVNQAFVQQIMKGRGAGARFLTRRKGTPIEIVGVVETGKYVSLGEKPGPALWMPLEQTYSSNASLVARSRAYSASTLKAIRSAVRDLDPAIALFAAGELSEQLGLPLFPARIAALVLAAFGVLALFLATLGLYGVMAYAVARRTREIGIRMALGATRKHVLQIVVRRAVILISAGLLTGLTAAWFAGSGLRALLYGVRPTDPINFVAVFALMSAVGIIACWLPAARASRIDPAHALRE